MPGARAKHDYTPPQDILDKFPDISGNTVNGLGETEWRPPAPFFWHPPDKQTHGELQHYVVSNFRPSSVEDRSFRNPNVDRGPAIIDIAPDRLERDAAAWTREIKDFVLSDEGDLVGVTPMTPGYVYSGYEIDEPTVIIIGVAHDYERLSQAPGTAENPAPYHDLHDQYNRAARVASRLANHIRANGYKATPFLGPMGAAINMIPAAIAAGMGELGKHGSIINRTYGSGFRLSAVATDLPLEFDAPDEFGAGDFCATCRICTEACPPAAIYDEKQMVRGEKKWYVDFDKCIPYFAEYMGCGICIAECPYTRPGVADRLVTKMAKRRARKAEN
ncbi:MAG: 4Fe-4S dicluster domain-containing protein [Pseudomonadota bacterium]